MQSAIGTSNCPSFLLKTQEWGSITVAPYDFRSELNIYLCRLQSSPKLFPGKDLAHEAPFSNKPWLSLSHSSVCVVILTSWCSLVTLGYLLTCQLFQVQQKTMPTNVLMRFDAVWIQTTVWAHCTVLILDQYQPRGIFMFWSQSHHFSCE